MKIVFLERESLGTDISVNDLTEFGEVEYYRNTTTEDEIIERIADAEIVIANKAPLTQRALDHALKLQYVVITATGYNNIDMAYCNERGIKVSNVAAYSTASVAQHTIAMALHLIERLDYYDTYVKSGAYSGQDFFTHFAVPFFELEGKTWGIVGMGNIGSKVAEIVTAFGCRVIYVSIEESDNKAYKKVDFDTLVEESEIISLHCPLTEQTRNMFTMETFKKMMGNTILINMARGPVVNEEDLCKALDEEYLAGAGIDVYDKEPLPKNSPLLHLQDPARVVFTPHSAWATVEARTRCVKEVYLNVRAFMQGEDRNVVH